MIEEAAGTSMYETKREDTAKLMATKDGKINEINHVSKTSNKLQILYLTIYAYISVIARRNCAEIE